MDQLYKPTDDIVTRIQVGSLAVSVEDGDMAALITHCTYLLGLFYIIGVMVGVADGLGLFDLTVRLC